MISQTSWLTILCQETSDHPIQDTGLSRAGDTCVSQDIFARVSDGPVPCVSSNISVHQPDTTHWLHRVGYPHTACTPSLHLQGPPKFHPSPTSILDSFTSLDLEWDRADCFTHSSIAESTTDYEEPSVSHTLDIPPSDQCSTRAVSGPASNTSSPRLVVDSQENSVGHHPRFPC